MAENLKASIQIFEVNENNYAVGKLSENRYCTIAFKHVGDVKVGDTIFLPTSDFIVTPALNESQNKNITVKILSHGASFLEASAVAAKDRVIF